MSGLLAVVAWLAALNPPRTRLGVPQLATGRPEVARLMVGIVSGAGVLCGLAALAARLFGALEISSETFRIAAGLVVVIAAAWMMFTPVPATEPEVSGALRMLWPIAFPGMVSPETIVLALSFGASEGVTAMLPGLITGSALLLALGSIRNGNLSGRVLAVTGRVVAAALVLVGVWLALQGVREV